MLPDHTQQNNSAVAHEEDTPPLDDSEGGGNVPIEINSAGDVIINICCDDGKPCANNASSQVQINTAQGDDTKTNAGM